MWEEYMQCLLRKAGTSAVGLFHAPAAGISGGRPVLLIS